jgi:hypothetical protein
MLKPKDVVVASQMKTGNAPSLSTVTTPAKVVWMGVDHAEAPTITIGTGDVTIGTMTGLVTIGDIGGITASEILTETITGELAGR